MVSYKVKQHFKLGGEHFSIKDEMGHVAFDVKGSFFKIPKTFTITDASGREVSRLEKAIFTFLPRFDVNLASGGSFLIEKKLSFWRDHYRIEGLGLTVDGDFWDMSFRLRDVRGIEVACITKEVFNLTSTYHVDISQENYKDLVISLVVAIDYVEMLESKS